MDEKTGSLAEAIRHSYFNRTEVLRSEACACFHCFARFGPADVVLWTDTDDDEDSARPVGTDDPARGWTAMCPSCEYTDVIGSAAGYALTDGFLRELHREMYGRCPGAVTP